MDNTPKVPPMDGWGGEIAARGRYQLVHFVRAQDTIYLLTKKHGNRAQVERHRVDPCLSAYHTAEGNEND